MSVQNPVFFLARERNLAEEAWPGDIIGIPNHGTLRVGDTLTEGADIRVTGIPELRARRSCAGSRIEDPMKPKHLRHALTNSPTRASPACSSRLNGSDWIIGVVGALQLDVLQARLQPNTASPTRLDGAPYEAARWLDGDPRRTRPLPRPQRLGAPRTMTASRSSSPATPGICAPPSRNGPPSASARPASSTEATDDPLDRWSTCRSNVGVLFVARDRNSCQYVNAQPLFFRRQLEHEAAGNRADARSVRTCSDGKGKSLLPFLQRGRLAPDPR